MLPQAGAKILVQRRYATVEPALIMTLAVEWLKPQRLIHAPTPAAGRQPCGGGAVGAAGFRSIAIRAALSRSVNSRVSIRRNVRSAAFT
jgi:hypothetical protein